MGPEPAKGPILVKCSKMRGVQASVGLGAGASASSTERRMGRAESSKLLLKLVHVTIIEKKDGLSGRNDMMEIMISGGSHSTRRRTP